MSSCSISVPLGFKFAPKDHEIITYLLHKITRTDILGGEIIKNADVFGDLPPWSLFEDSGSIKVGVVKYFFTVVQKKGKNGSRNFKRTVGKFGSWKGEDTGENIMDPKNKRAVLGTKRKFTFKTDLKINGKWLMTEYSLSGECKKKYGCEFSDYVIW